VQKNKRKILLVVDDCLTKKQQEIADYFVYGRHSGINVVYLTQAYFSINKDKIRNNTEVFIVFEISDTDLKNSYEQLGAKEFDTLNEYKSTQEKRGALVRIRLERTRVILWLTCQRNVVSVSA
jgi:hypothetical protein